MKLPSYEEQVAYREGCYSKQNAEDCHKLADFLKHKENDLQKAVRLYKVNCDDYGYAKSCMEYGNFAFTGVKEKNVKADPVEALKYFERGCSLGSSANCLNSGMLLVSPLLSNTAIQQDYPKGINYLKQSCDMDNGNACFYLSGMYMSGVDNSLKSAENSTTDKPKEDIVLAKDMKIAFSFAKKACELKNFMACSNLSQMYAKGEGTEKNMEKSQEYNNKAIEFRDEHNRKRILENFKHP